ncbi:MAG: hypothetical protein AAGN46_18115 [Acidobacteriota bacterium]
MNRDLRRASRAVAFGLVLLAGLACSGGDDTPAFSFLQGTNRWRADTPRLIVERVDARGPGDVELSLRIEATRPSRGERLTLWALVDVLDGSHPVEAFGHLAGVGAVAPRAVSSGCDQSDVGRLVIEAHDADRRLVSGSFLVNVCAVDDPDAVMTLGDGRFTALAY